MQQVLITEVRYRGNGAEFFGQFEDGVVPSCYYAYPDSNGDLSQMRILPVVGGSLEDADEVSVWGLDEIESHFPREARWFIERRRESSLANSRKHQWFADRRTEASR